MRSGRRMGRRDTVDVTRCAATRPPARSSARPSARPPARPPAFPPVSRALARPPAPYGSPDIPARWVHGGGGHKPRATPPPNWMQRLYRCHSVDATRLKGVCVLLATLLITGPCRPGVKRQRGGQLAGRAFRGFPAMGGARGYPAGMRHRHRRRRFPPDAWHSRYMVSDPLLCCHAAHGSQRCACIGADHQSQRLRRRRLSTAVNTMHVRV